jgi:hypothetical protein
MYLCQRCGAHLNAGLRYCSRCGTPVVYAPPRYQKRSARNPVILSATALILAVVLILGLWKPGFFWTLKETLGGNTAVSGEDGELADLLAEKPDYNPAPIPVSGTPAFSVSPADGITISAEKNALDKERTFTAVPLTEGEMGTLFFERSAGEWAPVYAFEFDAGLADDERLPGELNIDFDLNKLGVKEELWPYLNVVRLGDDGSATQLRASVTNKGIACATRQNCVLAITIGLGIGIPVMAIIERYQDGLQKLYPNEIFYEAIYPEMKYTKAQYRVLYPKCMARTDSAELKALDDRVRALIERYGLDPDKPLLEAAWEACEQLGSNPEYQDVKIEDAAYRLMQKFYNDPEYLSVQATFNDPQWQLRNLWPDSVNNLCNRLARADAYLFGERDFRVPSHVTDVLILDRWPHEAETPGVAKNLYTASPFIHINAAMASNQQDLLLTVTHEMFHVVQSGYVTYDSGGYTPFWEATALVLEKEAMDYYVTQQLMTSGQTELLTKRINWECYDKALMTPSEWENVPDEKSYMQVQGYAASYWIEFLRDRYSPGTDFLKQLMERFASSIGSLDTEVHRVLRDQTSSDDAAYCNDFRLFSVKNFSHFNERSAFIWPTPEKIELSADEPYIELKMPYQAFSTRVRDIRIDSADENGDALEYKVVVKGEAPGLVTPTLRFYQDNTFKAHLTGDGMLLLPESTSKLLAAHEIEDYFMTTPGATAGTGYTYELWLMLPPEAPEVEIDEEEDVMLVTPAEPILGSDILAGYDVVVITPEGDEFHFPQDYDDFEAEIPLEELESDKKNDETEEEKYIVYIVERVEFPDGTMQYGPDGKEYEEDNILRFEDILGTYDMTQTVSGFDSAVLDDALGQMEGVEGMEDYLGQYGQMMGGMNGTYSGTMIITEYQTGGEIAQVAFTYPDTENSSQVLYRGTWDKGVLHLEPTGYVLGGNWDLTFKKESGKITCSGTSKFDDIVASYTFTVTAVKRN